MVIPMASSVPAEELFQMRLLLERELLQASDVGDEQLCSSIDWLQAACGERQLTQLAVAATASRLHDEDAAVRQHAASTLSILACRSVFNQFKIAAAPGVTQGLVHLLSDEVSWVRGSAAAALTHLAMNCYRAMQSRILQEPGAATALVQLLHDRDAGLGCAAALAVKTLAENHPRNQTQLGLEPGVISGLVAMTLGEDGALQAMAHAALKRLAANHPVNRARIRRESLRYYVSEEQCGWPLDESYSHDVTGSSCSSSDNGSTEVCCC